jgi:glutathione-regulated potassium-efflux system ancillary protein KefG
MKKILILFAHPTFKRSTINWALREAVQHLDGITFHDLYANYPDLFIDVAREQRLCEQHEIIIFQHPFYWYSTPAIFKEWLDQVLEHNWAYGSRGTALAGKIFFQTLTAGGDARSYSTGGMNGHTIRELTSPFRATANLCKMEWLPPFAILGVHKGIPREKLLQHAEDYRRTLIALRDNKLDIQKSKELDFLNQNLNTNTAA